MKKVEFIIKIVFLACLFLTSCSLAEQPILITVSSDSGKTITPAKPGFYVLPQITSTASSTPTQTAIPSLTPSPTSAPTATPSLTPSPTSTPVHILTVSSDCPELVLPGEPDVLYNGTILFQYYGPDTTKEVFGVSNLHPNPFSALNPTGFLDQKLSVNGKKIAWSVKQNSQRELVVYDLETRQEQRFRWADSWKWLKGWTADGKVQIYLERNLIYGVGERSTIANLDIRSGLAVTETLTLDLPGHNYGSILDSFIEFDPSQELVFYTALTNQGYSLILRDIASGSDLWQSSYYYGDAISPVSAWAPDGSQVLFVIKNGETERNVLYSLSRDGKRLVPLLEIPAEFWSPVNNLQFSPDGQYLTIGLFREVLAGRVLLLDMVALSFREICRAGYLMMFPETWLPSRRQVIFLLHEGKAGDSHAVIELVMVDLDRWIMQKLVSGEKQDIWIYLLGWTPLSLP